MAKEQQHKDITMTTLTYQQPLIQTGLATDQAAVYETLIKDGALPARDIALRSGIGRTLTYKVLDELVALGLIEKHDEPKKVATFSAVHPIKLKETVEKRLESAQSAKANLESVLGKLTSDFNLVSGKPGVQFFEGLDGIKTVMDDTLTSKTEICAYIDIQAIEKYVPEYSREYSRRREKLGIHKRNISIDTPENRFELEGYFPTVTEERLLPWHTTSFNTTLQIYDDKISYLNLNDTHQIGIIIADPEIYTMQKALFEVAWNSPSAYIPPHKDQALDRSKAT
jgi:sugar-specific transcriptional regulator TrmB